MTRTLFAVLVALAMFPATASAALTAPQNFEGEVIGGQKVYGHDWATGTFSSYDFVSGRKSRLGAAWADAKASEYGVLFLEREDDAVDNGDPTPSGID